MLSQFILLNFAGALLQHRDDLVCNDPEISDQCLAKCRLDYVDCRANCDSQFCNSACLVEFQECEGSCPCGINCPTGCSDCPQHPLCADDCEDAQLNNESYKTCLNEAVNELEICLKTCPPNIDCHNSCYASYTEMLFQCPCIEKELTTTTTEVSTVTTTTTELPTDPNEVFILVITSYIDDSYLMSGDGSSQIVATINAPSNYYPSTVRHALVNGKLFIFGGRSESEYDGKKIARLDDCTLNEVPARLNVERYEKHEALTINNGSEALICFGLSSEVWKSCESFDGITSILSTFSAGWAHSGGGLGLYRNQPTSVGCYVRSHNKAETLTSSGWTALQDFPLDYIFDHTLVGLEKKSMLLFGGNFRDKNTIPNSSYQTGIWQLQDDHWSRIGELSEPAVAGSALYIGRSIYLFAGFNYQYPIHKIDMNDDEEIQKVEVIGNQPSSYWNPVLFQTNSDYCV